MIQAPKPPPVSVREFARQCGISIRQAYNLVEAREIESIRLPSRTGGDGVIRIEQADIDEFKKKHRQPAAASS